MTSTQQEEIGAALDAIDAGYARLRAACSDTVGNAFRVKVAERLETQCRINRGQMYRFFGELAEPPDGPDDPALPAGAVISKLLWKRLRITTGDVKARMKTAVRIRPRRTLTGQELEPELAHLAAAVESGHVGHDHIKAVCEAMDALPSAVPEHIKERAADVLREREVALPRSVVGTLEVVVENPADPAVHAAVRNEKIVVRPLLELVVVGGVVARAGSAEGGVELLGVVLVRNRGVEVRPAAEPRLRGRQEPRVHVHRGHVRVRHVRDEADAGCGEARVLLARAVYRGGEAGREDEEEGGEGPPVS